MPTTVGPKRTRRTNRRLARLRVANPGALPNVEADNKYTPREARKVRRATKRLSKREAAARPEPKPKYDPLAPLTGDRLRQERKAAQRLEFGPRTDELRKASGNLDQTAANRATYYDDWRQALRESTARVNETNRLNVEATEKRIDSAYEQDKSGVAARDAQASETAARLGRGPVQSVEGNQAVEAARSQGNQSAARLRGQAAADTKYLEARGTTAVLAKAQDQARLDAKREQLRGEAKTLAREKGAFRTDFTRRSRQDERQWSTVQKEFGLKAKAEKRLSKSSRADRAIEQQKLATQKIVARIYGAADKAGARAQIRVAQLQLKKGKITNSQFKTIKNIYEGLPGGAQPGPNGTSVPAKPGAKPKLQTWERDKVTNAVRILQSRKLGPKDRAMAIKKMQDEGVPLRLAVIAWNRYIRLSNKAVNDSSGSDRAQG